MAVTFNEGPIDSVRPRTRRGLYITDLILKTGIVKTEPGAQVVMLTITVCAFVAIALLLPDVLSSQKPPAHLPANPDAYNMP